MKHDKPEYLKLYEEMRREIIRGVWPAGSRLPSRRQMALDRGLSAVTVEHSYDMLCQEGYIQPRARSGFYVIYRDEDGFAASEEITVPRQTPVTGEAGETFPFSVLARAMRRVLSDWGEAIMQKSPNTGVVQLRRAIASYLDRNRGIQVSEEQIVIGSGSEYLYGLVVEMLGPNRVFCLEFPSYVKIEQVYRAKGVTCEMLPLGQDGIDGRALSRARGSVLHITPFRSYPSGVTASASKRAEYIRWSMNGDRYIVEDDFESEFSLLRKPEDTVYALSEGGNVIYLNTFTRTVSPSLRVGYMVLPEAMVEMFSEKVGFYSCTVPAFEQYVLAQIIDDGDLERHINRMRRKRRRQITDRQEAP
ncbi:MAG: PLP-dependent aminotransferase family protein [Clostridia bacterium]|nr:PLP-dependent aminotransferase family protein [Clostridia bacterium]